jgi:hypothetical protein
MLSFSLCDQSDKSQISTYLLFQCISSFTYDYYLVIVISLAQSESDSVEPTVITVLVA